MTPYAGFLRNVFLKLIIRLPFRLLLALLDSDEEETVLSEREIPREKIELLTTAVTELIADKKSFQSKYVRQIFKTVKSQLPKLIAEYKSGVTAGKPDEIEKTIRLVGQLLNINEINDLIVDFTAFINETSEFLGNNGYNTDTKEYTELSENLNLLILKCSSPGKSLNNLLTELSFQVFFLVAQADNVIDTKERAGYQKILKDREWCSGDFSHLCFAKTEYSYDELYSQLTSSKLKINMNEVRRTLRITDQLFKVKEVNLLKIDLYRLAKDIAKASGGIGGIGAISAQEKEVLDTLESHLGDIAAMQMSAAARQSDQVSNLIGSDDEKKARDKTPENAREDQVEQQTTMIHDPPMKAIAKIAGREIPATALYISEKGIQCQIEFKEVYIDLGKGVDLDLMFHFDDGEQQLADIRCKTIRNTVQKWNSKLIPIQMKIDWGFHKLVPEQQEVIIRFIQFCSVDLDLAETA